jgi:hypothetical protein
VSGREQSPDRPPLREIPIRDYMPDDLGAVAYGALARVSDDIRAARARRLLDECQAMRVPA